MNTADFAATAPWLGIRGKPESFPPSAHRHQPSDIERAGAEVGDVLTWDGRRYRPMGGTSRDFEVRVGESLASFRESLSVTADNLHASVTKTTELEARFGQSTAGIEKRLEVIARAGEASAKEQTRLSAAIGDAQAGIRRLDEVRVTRDTALARTTEQLFAKVGQSEADITTIKSSYATRTFAEAKKREAIKAAFEEASAHITTELSSYATITFAEAKKTEAISAAFGNASAQITTALVSYATQAFAEAKKTEAIAVALGDATALVEEEAAARIDADGQIHAYWGVKIDINGRVVGRIKLDGTAETSSLDMEAATIRLWNGTAAVAPFTLSGGQIRLTNVVVDTLDANIHITSPYIQGGILRLAGECLVCNTSADGDNDSLIRVNGGGGDGPTRGGQLDVFGNEYPTYGGSVFLTPSEAATGSVRLRDNDGTDRLIVHPSGGGTNVSLYGNVSISTYLAVPEISVSGTITVGSLVITSSFSAASLTTSGAVTCGDDSSEGLRSSGRIYLCPGNTPRWFVSDGSGDLNCLGNYTLKKATSDDWSIKLTMSGSAAVEFGESGGNLTYRINGGATRTITYT